MRLLAPVTFLFIFTLAVAAQNQSRRMVGDPRGSAELPPGTILHPQYDAALGPQSLTRLVSQADVIVEGTVHSILSSRRWKPEEPSSVETDTLFAVDRVLKGGPDTALRRLVITQVGGK